MVDPVYWTQIISHDTCRLPKCLGVLPPKCLGPVQQNFPPSPKDFSPAVGQTPPNTTKGNGLASKLQSNAGRDPRGTLKDYEEEDCGSGREADKEETEEEGFCDNEYDQEDADRENRFWDNEEYGGPRDVEIIPKLQQPAERPASRAGSESGKRRRIEEPTEQPDFDKIRNSVSPP